MASTVPRNSPGSDGVGRYDTAGLAVAAEPPSVKVELWNKNDGTICLTIDKKSVPAGPIEFEIRNTSTDLMHEFLIVPWPGASP